MDQIYTDLYNFRFFNGGNNDVATISTKMIDGTRYGFFDSIGIFGLLSNLINPTEVPVRLWADRSDRTVIADTAGWHMLVGQRRWRVSHVGGTVIEIETETYDYQRDWLNRLGAWGLGESSQTEIWTQYLKNIRDAYVLQDSAVPVGDIRVANENLGGANSPWRPVNPYPGPEVP